MSLTQFCFSSFMETFENSSSAIDLAWSKGINFVSENKDDTGSSIEFSVASQLHQNFFTHKFQPIVKKWCSEQDIPFPNIQSQVNTDLLQKTSSLEPEAPTESYTVHKKFAKRNNRSRPLSVDENSTFGNFVVGASNELAHSASLMSANAPGVLTNPLFIHGPSGLGKTHLLFSICNHRILNTPDTKVLYVSGEMFLNDFVEHIHQSKMREFRRKYRDTYDLLLIDDIHTVGKGPKVQEELFNTLNHYFLARKQVVITCDQKPCELKSFTERVRTRLGGGVLLEVQWPDYQLRSDFINAKLDDQKDRLDKNVLESLPLKNKLSIRELNGILNTLKFGLNIQGQEHSLAFADRLISGIENRENSLPHIQELVSQAFSIPVKDIVSKSRTRRVNRARQAFMFIARKCNFTTSDIGRSLCRDHTTILSGTKRLEKMMADDSTLKKTVEDLLLRVG